MKSLTAAEFVQELHKLRVSEGVEHNQGLKADASDEFIGVRMGSIFKLAKQFVNMPLTEVETLLDSPVHEVRVGAVSIMDYQARSKKLPDAQRKALFDLYIRRHDRINSWDLVDRAVIYVVGGYLHDQPRDILYKLARSKHPMERRSAILCTMFFMRQDDVEDTVKLSELLVHDDSDSVNKAVGWMLRELGKKDMSRLLQFLDTYAATMPRVTFRYATEHFTLEQKQRYAK